MATDSIYYGYYHGYSLFEKYNKEIAYPFGHGLSYSDFKYQNLVIKNIYPDEEYIELSLDIKNNSQIEGKEIIQLYVGFENSNIDRPKKLLKGFQKVLLKPNEIKEINFKIKIDDLKYYDSSKKEWILENITYNIFLGKSSDEDELLISNFKI